jgi:dienelactone hydrolase
LEFSGPDSKKIDQTKKSNPKIDLDLQLFPNPKKKVSEVASYVSCATMKAHLQLFLSASLITSTIGLARVRHESSNSRSLLVRRQMADDDKWTPLNPESLVSAPCLIEQTLCQINGDQPQLAKDFNYATAVLDAWRQEEAAAADLWEAETHAIQYCDEDGTALYGHVIRKKSQARQENELPGVVFFHTGAGPHDLFLLWKAVSLVHLLPGGCVVFVADLLSDESGWAWGPDRARYNRARDQLLRVDETTNTRPALQKTIHAALQAVSALSQVDCRKLAALGWCLGGHPVLELGRMKRPEIRAMVTFHGVFGGSPVPKPDEEVSLEGSCEILICHGTEDPFVPPEALKQALETLQYFRHTTSLLQLRGAKHGFSNPAQDFNDNPAFGFNQEAASKAWRQALALLKRRLTAE